MGDFSNIESLDNFFIEMGDFTLVKKRDYHNCLWECTEGGSIDQKPVILDGKIFFGSFNHMFFCLDLKSGDTVWTFKAQDRIGLSSPVLYKDSVIFGSYDYNVYRLDTKTGGLIWKYRTQGEIASTGMVSDGVYYVTSRDQNLHAVDCETGKLIWKASTREPNVSVPTVHQDRIYFGSSDRNLYCLDKKTGAQIWKYEAEEEIICITPFMVVENMIFVGTMGTIMHAIDINTGRCAWKKKFGDYGMTRGQVIVKDMLIQPTQGGGLYAFMPDGRIIWKISKNHAFTSVITDGEHIYTGSEDLHYYCFDSEGKEVWKFKMDGPVWQPGKIHDGVVYIGSYDCNLYALDIKTGKLVWKHRVPGSPGTYIPMSDFFELEVNVSKETVDEESSEKRYDMSGLEEDEGASAYKSRITYQVSTQYSAKGKYQKDSHEEEF